MRQNIENHVKNKTGVIAGDHAQIESPLGVKIKSFGNASMSHGKGYAVDDKSIQESTSMYKSTNKGYIPQSQEGTL